MIFEIKKPVFDLELGQTITMLEWPPTRGCLVMVEFGGTLQIARYHGRSVELGNGTFTWLYKFLGVVQRAASRTQQTTATDDEKNDFPPRPCRRGRKQRVPAENF